MGVCCSKKITKKYSKPDEFDSIKNVEKKETP